MISLHLIPDTHKGRPIVKANFAYDRGLIDLVKKAKGSSLGSTFKAKAFIDYSQPRGSKTTEIYTHVSKKSLANIKNPLETTKIQVLTTRSHSFKPVVSP